MRVLIVNTSETAGGAAVAARRLLAALQHHGVKASMLVRDKQSSSPAVLALPHQQWQQWHFLWERLRICLALHLDRTHLFKVDTATGGTDITRLDEFRQADIVHLHWVNQGMLSLGDIARIVRSGKPVVWTMHDAWPATGICHLTMGCQHFKSRCGHCPLLPGGGSATDLSARTWRRKQALYADSGIHFVACSRWLEGEARQSALLAHQHLTSIPNPIDTRLYSPGDGSERQRLGLPGGKRLLLFVSQRVDDIYKGMDQLAEACRLMADSHPDTRQTTALLIMGGHAEQVAATGRLPYEVIPLGYVNDERRKVDIYRAADAFVLPSLSENLPNTIMEAMACGTPAVAFRVGGIPEMVEHRRTGYLAQLRSAADLAAGLHHVLYEADRQAMSRACVAKVQHTWGERQVALRYIELYNEALAMKHYL
ncbi:MAG: glycosyltransferase [Prevotella sp.]|nr:glycosyltransferase [Prevotella sp.]